MKHFAAKLISQLIILSLFACSFSPSAKKYDKPLRQIASTEQQSEQPQLVVDNDTLKEIVARGLNYLQATQVQETVDYEKFKGEWPSYMINLTNFPLLGPAGKGAYDSNNFSVATIHNLLAKMYLENPELDAIPPMLAMAVENILAYKSNDSFNFWPWIPMKEVAKKKKKDDNPEMVHGPTHYDLKSRFINNAANVANDSDDTAQGYRALMMNRKVAEKSGAIPGPSWMRAEPIGTIFSEFVDKKRHKAHFFNIFGTKVESGSGAFLTWLSHEAKFFALRNIIPSYKGNYIPYGVNDVDAVVNTNVLSALAMYGELETTEGVAAACKLVNEAFEKEKSHKYDIYYPNSFTLHYTAAHAYSLGVKCIEQSVGSMLSSLWKTQKENGSWEQDWTDDVMQSTAYALASLIDLKDNSRMTHEMLKKGIEFLINNLEEDESGIHWKGGIFFSGGTVIRKNIVWKSDAVTTAYILYVLEQYRLRQLVDLENPFYMEPQEELNMDPYYGYYYRQKSYELFDLQGDVALAGSLKVFLQNGMAMLKGDEEHTLKDKKTKEELAVKYADANEKEVINPILEDKPDYTWTKEEIEALEISPEAKELMLKYAVGTTFSIDGTHSKPFKVKNISKMFMQVVYEEYEQHKITPKMGNVHDWHPDFKSTKEYRQMRAIAMKPFSKLMHALFKGVSSRFLVTGQEKELTLYVNSFAFNSVTLDQVFRKSYQLNNGDIYLSLLTIENIFSEYWNDGDFGNNRDHRSLTRRLSEIHHHFNWGDKYGAWYHLFGMMLYGYVNGSFPARIVGIVEAFGAGLFSRFAPDGQENYINRKGGNVGARLKRLVKNFNKEQKWPEKYFAPDAKYLDPAFYLEPEPDWSQAIIKRLKKDEKKREKSFEQTQR